MGSITGWSFSRSSRIVELKSLKLVVMAIVSEEMGIFEVPNQIDLRLD